MIENELETLNEDATMRFFNTAGPVNPIDHYCLPPMARLDVEHVLSLVAQKKYFVLHAPRQTGKTSALLALMDYLNREGTYASLYVNVEKGQGAREDVERGVFSFLAEIASRARDHLDDTFPLDNMRQIMDLWGPDSALNEMLSAWTRELSKPLVLLVDEIDSLVGDTLISVLRQIRSGYDKRPSKFPQSILLCGVRDVRDYRIHSSREKAIITGGSAFNIKAKSLRVGNFDRDDVRLLLAQHAEETGQAFEAPAQSLVWEYTRGQPWLVNALAYEACFEMKEGRDRSKPVVAEWIEQAKDSLILRGDTHLDQLADKLSEERVRSVIEPLLTGTREPGRMLDDDIQYVVDLGLITRKPHLEIANDIYKEVVPRTLTATTQEVLPVQPQWYVRSDGLLDVDGLMAGFQDFFREHSEHWVDRFDYKEAGPQLLLQAFLQRIVNAGGRIDREYGLGRKRTDLMVAWKHEKGVQKIVLELKVLHKSLEHTIKEGLAQLAAYMDICGSDNGHLVVFDRDPDRKWEEKIFRRNEVFEGRKIEVWGM